MGHQELVARFAKNAALPREFHHFVLYVPLLLSDTSLDSMRRSVLSANGVSIFLFDNADKHALEWFSECYMLFSADQTCGHTFFNSSATHRHSVLASCTTIFAISRISTT